MSGPPIPPRRKRAPGSSKTHDYAEDDYTQSAYQYDAYDAPAATAGRFKQSTAYDYEDDLMPRGGGNDVLKNILDESPETTIGRNVKVKGELAFDKLLRVDGAFEGKLLSKGDLVIGKTGSVTGDIIDMGVVVNDGGKIVGNVSVERLELRGKASVHGNITCKSLKIDPTTVIVGSINVNPFAPSKVDPAGNIVEDSSERMPAIKSASANKPQDLANTNGGTGTPEPNEKKSKKKLAAGGDA